MAKKKRTKKQISEEARLKAENDPVVRELRRRAAAIDAELEARRRGDAPASA
jgi:hypothetical protein